MELSGALAEELGPKLTGRFLFYGHSMGATVAYRLARHQQAVGGPLPQRLLLGAAAAPHLAHALRQARRLTDAELVEWLVRTSARPESMAEYLADTRRLPEALALVREDLRLCAGTPADREARPLLPCPIEVFAGERDPLVPYREAAKWSSYSASGCLLHLFPGGHFFQKEAKESFFAVLQAALGRATEE